MNSAAALSPDVFWRVFEKEMFEQHFGPCEDLRPEGIRFTSRPFDTFYWKLASESMTQPLLNHCLITANEMQCNQINSPAGWLYVHCKDMCFSQWVKNDIPCPSWKAYEPYEEQEFHQREIDYPILFRINNATGGKYSYFCRDVDAAWMALKRLQVDKRDALAGVPRSRGIQRRLMAVKFIYTGTDQYNLSYRLIVAGKKIVAGYARLSDKTDWCVITGKFKPQMREAFIHEQQRCAEWCIANEELVVKAVNCLGLNFQGVDVIRERGTDQTYFIEVQPGFSVGYANHSGWLPPFYNPSYPKELRQWLIDDADSLSQLMPWYYERWLNKRNMFDAAFRALKESFDENDHD